MSMYTNAPNPEPLPQLPNPLVQCELDMRPDPLMTGRLLTAVQGNSDDIKSSICLNQQLPAPQERTDPFTYTKNHSPSPPHGCPLWHTAKSDVADDQPTAF